MLFSGRTKQVDFRTSLTKADSKFVEPKRGKRTRESTKCCCSILKDHLGKDNREKTKKLETPKGV